MSECQDCDGSGFYVPAFSAAVQINCLTCNADFSKVVWDEAWDEDDADG